MISLTSAPCQGSTSPQSLLFLQRVATDEEFRCELESNPAAALAQFGFEVDELPEKVVLPGQDDVRASLEYLANDPIGPNLQQVHWSGFFQSPC